MPKYYKNQSKKQIRSKFETSQETQHHWQKNYFAEAIMTTQLERWKLHLNHSKKKLKRWKFKKTTFYNATPLQQAAAKVM